MKKYTHAWLAMMVISSKYGTNNSNTWDFLSAITQYSFLTAYQLIPKEFDETNLKWDKLRDITKDKFETFSKLLLTDSVDSVSRVWLRIWMRFEDWQSRKTKCSIEYSFIECTFEF